MLAKEFTHIDSFSSTSKAMIYDIDNANVTPEGFRVVKVIKKEED